MFCTVLFALAKHIAGGFLFLLQTPKLVLRYHLTWSLRDQGDEWECVRTLSCEQNHMSYVRRVMLRPAPCALVDPIVSGTFRIYSEFVNPSS